MSKQTSVIVTDRNQVPLPNEVADQLNLQPGDRLLVNIQNGVIVLTPEPKSYTERLAGLHSEIWENMNTDDYLQKERDSSLRSE